MLIVCKWCGRDQGILKGILICPSCDFNHKYATSIPNGHLIKDVKPK